MAEQDQKFQAAVRLARRLGVGYRPASDIAAGSISDLLSRIALLEARSAVDSPQVVASVLGGVAKPVLRLSGLFEAYEKNSQDRLIGKSTDQIRKWRNPRILAVENAVSVIGDRPLADITRGDALGFKAWWLDRVREEDYDQGTANKNMGFVATMMRAVNDAWRLELSLPFACVRLSGERHAPRVPCDPDFVRERILPGVELSSLNPEARAIVRLVAATGMRPSEVAALTRHRIVLDAKVPHVMVRPEQRQLKTYHSERDMPLVGVALEIMKEFPDGFPRYRDAPDSFSATANKALDAAGLRPTPAHTVYSLRHTFKDRLIALEAPERIQDALMGHAVRGIEYGAGATLAHRAEWLARVWGRR